MKSSRYAFLCIGIAMLGSTQAIARFQDKPIGTAVPKIDQVPKSAEPALEADKLRRAAMISADIEKVSSLVSDDLVYTHSSGKVDDKKSFLDAIRSGSLDYEKIEPRSTVVRAKGGTVVVTGLVAITVKAPDGLKSFDARFTAVHMRNKEGNWQLMAWQTTRLPEPPK
jgi:ketosteroid isomerase-like protein